jgi:uncharacterized BrkB/YihY/UPF0761 family membrane protein
VFITLLLVFGKSAISWYIGNSQINELGGASSSVIVLMLWIYYSSLIVFLGAELIKSMAAIDNVVLRPKRYAVRVESVIVEEKKKQEEENQELTREEHETLPPPSAEATADEAEQVAPSSDSAEPNR